MPYKLPRLWLPFFFFLRLSSPLFLSEKLELQGSMIDGAYHGIAVACFFSFFSFLFFPLPSVGRA